MAIPLAPAKLPLVQYLDKGLQVDNNPHLADKDLVFEIELVEIENT